MRHELVWMAYEGEPRCLGYRDAAGHLDAVDPDTSGATLEELADFCDGNAEGCNAHDFVGVHRLLAALLHRHVDRARATAIMREIAERGGLDGMNGVCGKPDSFAELGIPKSWKSWSLDDEGSPADGR